VWRELSARGKQVCARLARWASAWRRSTGALGRKMNRTASPRRVLDIDAVRAVGLSMPVVEERTIHGAMSLKVNGKLVVCPAIHKSAEPNSLMVRVSRPMRSRLIASNPRAFYVTDHYAVHSAVLVRLDKLTLRTLRSILLTAVAYAKEAD
jgi:hypothetical protein